MKKGKIKRPILPGLGDWIAGAWVGFWGTMAVVNQRRQTKWEGLRFLQRSGAMWFCIAFAVVVMILHLGKCNKRKNERLELPKTEQTKTGIIPRA